MKSLAILLLSPVWLMSGILILIGLAIISMTAKIKYDHGLTDRSEIFGWWPFSTLIFAGMFVQLIFIEWPRLVIAQLRAI